MLTFALCAGLAVFLWWLGTGIVLRLDRVDTGRRRGVMVAAATIAALAFVGIALTSGQSTLAGVCIAFACAITVWGVVELSYYLGYVAGVHRRPCPPACSEGRRFALALGASVYHELAVAAAIGISAALTYGAANQLATWTLVTLAVMRWSTKLNLFLGVPVFNASWLPSDLAYVATYVRRRALNYLFPVSVGVSTVVCLWLLDRALGAPAGGPEQAGLVLLATLLALGILEHWFLVLRLGEDRLWQWAQRSKGAVFEDCGADASGTVTVWPPVRVRSDEEHRR